jgi:putrescine aminotransferase
MSESRLTKLRNEYRERINPSLSDYAERAGLNFIPEGREGTRVSSEDGRSFIDCRDDAGVFNFGHRNPILIKALTDALAEFDIGNNLFLSEARLELAKALSDSVFGGGLSCVNFGVSGGEIADLAIKMARAYTNRTQVVGAKGGYHGCTGFSVSAGGDAPYQKPFKPLVPKMTHVKFGDVRAMERAITKHTACVILEPVQGHAGVKLAPKDYFKRVRELCDENDVVLIIDEIQTGFGRCGSFLAIEEEGIVPDMVLLGKAMSGGLTPITAVLFKNKYLEFWDKHPMSHQSTFGGNELACKVAIKTLELAQDNGLYAMIEEGSKRFAEFFEQARKDYPALIKDFRYRGYLMCLEMKSEEQGWELSRQLFARGVLAEPLPHTPNMIRILPSLNTPLAEVDELIESFGTALKIVQHMDEADHPIKNAVREFVQDPRPIS